MEVQFDLPREAPDVQQGLWPAIRPWAAAALDRLLGWHELARQGRALLALNDRMLKDIGITRADAEREASRPFWGAGSTPGTPGATEFELPVLGCGCQITRSQADGPRVLGGSGPNAPAALKLRAAAVRSARRTGRGSDQRLGEALIRLMLDHGQTAVLHRARPLAAAEDGDRNADTERQPQQNHCSECVIAKSHPCFSSTYDLTP